MTAINFDGQVAIVTGAGRGMGRTYALELAKRGASVVVNDLRGSVDYGESVTESAADTVVEEITSTGGRAIACHDSVSTPEGGQGIVAAAIDAFGGVDIIIHNAGLRRHKYFHEMTVDEIRLIMDVHLGGGYWITRTAWPSMMAKGYGRILLVSSSAGAFGMKGVANYSGPKAGLIGLMKGLAAEGESCGIHVNALLPAAVTYDENRVAPAGRPVVEEEKNHADSYLMSGRFAPEYVAPLALYLVSAQCQNTGEIYSAVDGRYARAAMGLTLGWYSPETKVATPEDIHENIARIRDAAGIWFPSTMIDELQHVAALRRDAPG
jgi:NAD(P)-dependent dehydrogenase (short-subunit alcohol dehydrogenase family)